RHVRQPVFLAPTVASLFDRAQIGKEIESATDLLEWLAEPIGRRRVVAGLDVAPILLYKRSQIAEETAPVRHRPPAQRCRHGHRTAHSSGEELLTEIPADACGLTRIESQFV